MVKLNFAEIKSRISRIRIPRISLPSSNNPRTRIILIAAGTITATVIAAATYGAWFTSQPDFCQSCHEIKPQVVSWSRSVHAEVSCQTCHFTGALGGVKGKVALIGETVAHVTGSYKKPINIDSALSKKIDNDGCLQCHSPKRTITPRRTLVMDHNIHLEKGINCTTCHNRAGHPDLQGYKSFISMDGCFRCHGLSKTALAPGRCDACHPKSFDLVPVSHKTATWQRPDHGKTARNDTSPCLTCHQQTFCRGCHGVEVPHPDKFVKGNHGAVGKKNPAVCQKCHQQTDFCNACHHKGYNGPQGGWVKLHRHTVAQTGVAYCFDCHGPTYCARCHVSS